MVKQEEIRKGSSGKVHKQNLYSMVSIIIPTYNRPEMLIDAVKSVQNQTYKNIEIIVVNDGGCDVEHTMNSPLEDRIIYVKHSFNKGLAASRNTGISMARGKYIVYLDDDDIIYPPHIETLLKALIDHQGWRVAYTNAYRAIQERQGGKLFTIQKDIYIPNVFDADVLLAYNTIPVLCVMHEKLLIEEVGAFDESLNVLEDWDLWIRMSRLTPFLHIKKATCEFRLRDDGSTMTSSNPKAFLRTKHIIFEKYKDYSSRNPLVKVERALTYFHERKFKEAEAELKKSLSIGLFDRKIKVNALIHLANIYVHQQRYKEAEKRLKESLSLKPLPKERRTSIYYTLGSTYEREGSLDKAKKSFETVIKLFDKEVYPKKNDLIGGAHFHLGCIYQKMRKNERAKHHLEECLKFIPNHGKAWQNLSSIYLEQGKPKEAEEKFKEVLSSCRTENIRCDILIQMSVFYSNQQRFKEAKKRLKEALALKAPYKEGGVYYTLGSTYKREGSLDKAKKSFETVIKLFDKEVYPERSDLIGGAHFHLGCIYQKMGEKERARQHLEECLQFIPEHKKARELIKRCK